MPAVTQIKFEEFVKDNVSELLEKSGWMKTTDMKLCSSLDMLRSFIDTAINFEKCAVDLETTGLNTRIGPDGKPYEKIVGICLAYTTVSGIYVPMNHKEGSHLNLDESAVLEEIRRLCANCFVIVHHAKFDLQFLKNYGVLVNQFDRFDDTMILARLYDAGQKEIGLKPLSAKLLGRPMIDFDQITSGSKRFDMVSPDIGVSYAVADAMNTLALHEFFHKQQTVIDQLPIVNLEKRTALVVMQMEANLVNIDREYLLKEKVRITARLAEIEKSIYEKAGKEFNVGSTQQLGKILFDELKYEHPEKQQKTESGQYKTDNATLEKIADKYPLVKGIIEYRELQKSLGTYVENLVNNCDEKDRIKLSFNQVGTDTGRFSSPGGKGIKLDGYSGVNVQSIPSNYSPDSPDIRKAFKASPGNKIVAMDFAGEELRVAANLSGEDKWINEFLHGDADIHSATASAIYKKEELTKVERSLGKTCNFMILYGGGPRGLSEKTGMGQNEAQDTLKAFFEGLPKLKRWLDRERAKSRRLKSAKTSFGRIRPLHMFYDSGDRGLEAHADRCATNFLVQGCLKSTELVLTDKGYLSILDVKVRKDSGESMKVWTGTSWETFDVLNRGKYRLAEIELHNGMKLDCDTRHEVLTVGETGYEFKKFNELNENSLICTSVPSVLKFGSWPSVPREYGDDAVHNKKKVYINSKEEWIGVSYLLGTLIGDGSVVVSKEYANRSHNQSSICFGKAKLDRNFLKLKKIVNDLGLNLGTPLLSKTSIGESYKSNIYSASFIDLLKDLGYDFEQKRIPKRIFSSPLDMRVSFLKGLCDTDGAKNSSNRFGFHSPNRELLKDIQLLGWTLGCASRIFKENSGAYILSWESLESITSILNIACPTRCKYRGRDMILPKFMHGEILKRLEPCVPHTNAEKALLNKLRKGQNVSTQSMVQFLRSKGCDLPQMYFYYKLKTKRVLETEEETYTLSVHSTQHRFDSAGIISKNTCADIMKTVMVRVHNWIHSNNLQDKIKILITMHDELVFEMPADKIEEYIPKINNIMALSDILQKPVAEGGLGWPVPLVVDAEYGDTWHVDHDLFKEKPELKGVGGTVQFLSSTQVTETPMKVAEIPSPTVSIGDESARAETSDIVMLSGLEDLISFKEQPGASLPISTPEFPSDRIPIGKTLAFPTEHETLKYVLRDRRKSTIRKLNDIINYLREEVNIEDVTGLVKVLSVCDQAGNILTVSDIKVPVELFLHMARYEGV